MKEMDVIELLNELAEQQESDLKAKKRDELRAILSSLKQGESHRIVKMKKADLVAEILEAVADYRETLRKAEAFDRVVPDLTESELENIDAYVTKVDIEDDNDLGEVAEDTYKQFRSICQARYVDGQWLEYPAALADLANQLAARLEARGNASTTILKYRSEVLNHMERLLEAEREQYYFEQFWRYLTGHSYDDVKRGRKSRGKGTDCLPCFAKSLYTIWQFTHAAEKARVDQEGRDVKELSYKGLDITAMLGWANDLLTNLEPTDKNRKLWRPVSVALALATGRRQVEIHSTATFTYVDEYHVLFAGQAKTRGKAFLAYQETPTYIIPTLLKADLVVKGHEWLKANSGKFYDSEKKVNDNVNRDANAYLRDIAGQTVKVYNESGEDISDEVTGQFTYHDLREVYALASYKAEGYQKYKRNVVYRWVNEVLGEDRGGSGAISTAARYVDEYDLTDASVARI
jgi:hypothetical protein